MRAITLQGTGDSDVMVCRDVDDPTPRDGEMLIDVVAAGINRADMLQRAGHYPPPPGGSELLGLEVSGRVAAAHGDWQVGDECVALLTGGGYAERVAVPSGQVIPPPPGMDLTTAAGVVEVAATVVSNLSDLLREDQTVLIHGGAGGIGSFAIQYAKARGCTVAITAGTDEKLEHCGELGADIALNYHDDWVAGIKEHGGADVILDIMGAKYLPLNVSALRIGGHLVVIGLQGGRVGELDLGKLIAKRASVTATTLRHRPVAEKAAICQRVVEEVWPMFADGRIRRTPQTVFDLGEAAKAHDLLASGTNIGKVVLQVSSVGVQGG